MKFNKVITSALVVIAAVFLSGCNKDEKLYYLLGAENFKGSAYEDNRIYNNIVSMIQFETIDLNSKSRTFEDAKNRYESSVNKIKNNIQENIDKGEIIITEPGSVDILLISSLFGGVDRKTEIKTNISFEPKKDN